MRTLAGLVVLLGVALGQGQDNCDGIRFQSCTDQLGDYWGADPNAIWESPQLFAETINQRFLSPYELSNLVNVCNGLSFFYQCLTRRNLDACLGPIGWVGRGRSPTTAYAFDGMLNSLLFQCGPGFQSLIGKPDVTSCLQRVTVNYDSDIQNFYRSYELNVQHDPGNACLYGQTLVNGVSGIYSTGPCLANQGHAQWYSCEMTRNYVFSQFSHCKHQITCASINSAAKDFSSMIRKTSSGELEFLLPAHWDHDDSGNWFMTEDRWI